MSSGDVIRPFRWDVTKRSQLGSLPEVDPPETYPEFEDDLLAAGARVLAFAGDSDLVFVGRSPQPLFDLLSGLLLDTTWTDRLRLLNISLRHVGPPTEEQLRAIYPYFEEVGLDPRALAHRSRPSAFVDVVDTGETMEGLFTLLESWARRERVEWRAVARKVRIVGMTWREKTSPNTWRWQQEAEWVDRLRPGDIKNVSLPGRLATYLAADNPKASTAFPPEHWGDEELARPVHDDERRRALALAVALFDHGRLRETRLRFARELARQPQMKDSWLRSLILELKH